jgi:hypothetical protein
MKKTPKWWTRLTTAAKPANVKVDWNSWKDEDEG